MGVPRCSPSSHPIGTCPSPPPAISFPGINQGEGTVPWGSGGHPGTPAKLPLCEAALLSMRKAPVPGARDGWCLRRGTRGCFGCVVGSWGGRVPCAPQTSPLGTFGVHKAPFLPVTRAPGAARAWKIWGNWGSVLHPCSPALPCIKSRPPQHEAGWGARLPGAWVPPLFCHAAGWLMSVKDGATFPDWGGGGL